MDYLLDRPELALSAGLAVTLALVISAFARKIRDVGDEVGARLDALSPQYSFADVHRERVPPVPPDRRDYSSDRGPAPAVPPAEMAGFVPIWRDLYTETARRLGINPLGG